MDSETFSIEKLVELMAPRRFVVLSGAGISTDSGIPDYRGPLTQHIPRNPVQHDEFVQSAEARRRYWSRAARGFEAVGKAVPNAGHIALAQLGRSGHVGGVLTQNVDGLHQAAGSTSVLELHGSLHRVTCLACAKTYPRQDVQHWMERDNPGWVERRSESAPDGDAEVTLAEQQTFQVPRCPACTGPLMPDVVFFGGSVPKARTASALQLLADSEGLLVLGSSLTVFSGYRFVRAADRLALPVAIVTLGHTRGHQHAQVAVDAPLGQVLPALAEELLDR